MADRLLAQPLRPTRARGWASETDICQQVVECGAA
jgi:hypothetical protein